VHKHMVGIEVLHLNTYRLVVINKECKE